MVKLGAVAIVKAHPIVFGLVLAASIGIVVYQIVKSKKQKNLKYSRSPGSNRPDSGGGGAVSSGVNEFVDYEEMKSNANLAVPVKLEASDNKLRKRQVAGKTSFNITNSETSHEKKCNSSTGNFNDNQNILETKVLSDKNLDTAMSRSEKVNEYLRHISSSELADSNEESDSTYGESSSTDSSEESDSTNDIVKPVKKFNNQSRLAEISSTSSDSGSSSWSCISLTDINNLNKKTSRASSICSVTSIETESSIGTVLSGDSEVCRACKKNPVNTSTQPCNHHYMCSDCAFRIFPLFKKCKVCRTRIERIVVEE